jgi:hypothetical protein
VATGLAYRLSEPYGGFRSRLSPAPFRLSKCFLPFIARSILVFGRFRNHMTCGSNESDRFEQNPQEIHIECLIWTLDDSEVMHLRPSTLAQWVTSWRKAMKDFVLQRSTGASRGKQGCLPYPLDTGIREPPLSQAGPALHIVSRALPTTRAEQLGGR